MPVSKQGSVLPRWAVDLVGKRTRAGALAQDWKPAYPAAHRAQENLWRVGHCGIEAKEKGYKVGRPNTFLSLSSPYRDLLRPQRG